MPLSKRISAEAAKQRVLEYQPPKIDLGVPGTALETFEALKAPDADFRLSDPIKVRTGLDRMEAAEYEQMIEKKVLERVKDIQEPAFQEAYQLGLEEGRKEAFMQNSELIDQRIKELDSLIESIKKMKTDLLSQHERSFVELAFHMAKRLAAYQISVEPDATVSIIRQAVEMSQSEESLVVEVAPQHLEFLDSLRTQTGREFEFLKRVKFEPNEAVKGGGCIITSNYGEVDSRLDERIGKLWAGLEEILPRPKARLTVAS